MLVSIRYLFSYCVFTVFLCLFIGCVTVFIVFFKLGTAQSLKYEVADTQIEKIKLKEVH